MRYQGKSFECSEDTVISEAIVTSNRLAIDYLYENSDYHLQAKSLDGLTYHGTYGDPSRVGAENLGSVQLTRYDNAEGDVVLYGEYYESDSGSQGSWLLMLKAEK